MIVNTAVWVCGCMGVCAYGCVGVWVYVCMGVWVCGCVGVYVHSAGIGRTGTLIAIKMGMQQVRTMLLHIIPVYAG